MFEIIPSISMRSAARCAFALVTAVGLSEARFSSTSPAAEPREPDVTSLLLSNQEVPSRLGITESEGLRYVQPVFKLLREEDQMLPVAKRRGDVRLACQAGVISQNLVWQEAKPNPVTVDRVRNDIEVELRAISKCTVFSDRQVFLLAHCLSLPQLTIDRRGVPVSNERRDALIAARKGDDRIFGPRGYCDAIKLRSKVPPKLFRPKSDGSDAKSTIDLYLDSIGSAELSGKGLTIAFDGLGEREALYLAGSPENPKTSVTLSPDTLAKVITKKEKAIRSNEGASPTVLVLDACYSSDFVQNVIEALKKSDGPLQIVIISSVQLGQQGEDEVTAEGVSQFAKILLDDPSVPGKDTVGEFVDRVIQQLPTLRSKPAVTLVTRKSGKDLRCIRLV